MEMNRTEKMKQKAGKLSAVANYKFTSSAEKAIVQWGCLFQVGKFRNGHSVNDGPFQLLRSQD